MLLLTQSSSTTGDLHGASRGHLYGETFLFVMTWGRGGTDCYCQVVVEARGAAMHPTAPRIALHKEELSCPKCQSCWSQEILFYHILNINSARRGTSIFRIWTHTLYTHIDQRNEKKKRIHILFPLSLWPQLILRSFLTVLVSTLPGAYLIHLYILRAWKLVRKESKNKFCFVN